MDEWKLSLDKLVIVLSLGLGSALCDRRKWNQLLTAVITWLCAVWCDIGYVLCISFHQGLGSFRYKGVVQTQSGWFSSTVVGQNGFPAWRAMPWVTMVVGLQAAWLWSESHPQPLAVLPHAPRYAVSNLCAMWIVQPPPAIQIQKT